MSSTMTAITTSHHPYTSFRFLKLVVLSLVGITALAITPALPAQTATVVLSLSRFSKIEQLGAGPYVGVSPGRIVIHVGDAVVFSNADTRHHTATAILDAGTFPSDTPQWTDQAVRSHGKIGQGAWSTGDIAPGQRSAPIVATRPGTFLYGCFYDYSAGMRGEIVVEP
jgi:plastocyanin